MCFLSRTLLTNMKDRKKRSEKSAPIKKVEPKTEKPASVSDEDSRPDFGGLPVRDLKKNLGGCG